MRYFIAIWYFEDHAVKVLRTDLPRAEWMKRLMDTVPTLEAYRWNMLISDFEFNQAGDILDAWEHQIVPWFFFSKNQAIGEAIRIRNKMLAYQRRAKIQANSKQKRIQRK